MEIQKFKTAGTEGLIACKIKSIMTPLLGDHVLREANHYIRLLESFKKIMLNIIKINILTNKSMWPKLNIFSLPRHFHPYS